MFMDIVNFMATLVVLAILLFLARWIYLTGVKDGRAALKAEIEFEKVRSEIAELKAS